MDDVERSDIVSQLAQIKSMILHMQHEHAALVARVKWLEDRRETSYTVGPLPTLARDPNVKP